MKPKNPDLETPSVSRATTAYRYRGNGDSLPGVPARDLTKDEFDALSDEQKELVRASGVYAEEGDSDA